MNENGIIIRNKKKKIFKKGQMSDSTSISGEAIKNYLATNPTVANPAAPTARTQTWKHAMENETITQQKKAKTVHERAMTAASNPVAMAGATVVIVFILLSLIKPPFVMDKPKNRLEESKYSAYKALVWSLMSGTVAFSLPFVLEKLKVKK